MSRIQFRRVTLANCAEAVGAVVVIDVLRAFTTAAFALAGGATSITLVSTVEEALALRREIPDAYVMGEVGGLPVPEFDFGNSPARLLNVDLNGRSLIQRTSSGTQGVVLSRNAAHLVAASFVVARATASLVRRLAPDTVTFVITGQRPDGRGEEDAACADYLEALLCGQQPDPAPYLARVRHSINGRHFASPDSPDFPSADLDCAVDLDRFDFAMSVVRQNGRHILRPIRE